MSDDGVCMRSLFFCAVILTNLAAINSANAGFADILGDVACSLKPSCLPNKVNQFQEETLQQWMDGDLTAKQAVDNIVEFHGSLYAIAGSDKELYRYYYYIARECDSSRMSKEEGLYLMTKKDNELNEKSRAQRAQAEEQQQEYERRNKGINCTTTYWNGVANTSCN